MIKIALCKFNNMLLSKHYKLLRACLPHDIKQKFDKVKTDKQKQFVALQYLLLKTLLGKKDKIEIKTPKNGKPFIDGAKAFNESHSGDYFALAIGDNKPIGIELQKVTNVKEKHLKRICSDEELDTIGNDSFEFTKLWTRKESYIKMKGQTIIQDLRKIDTIKNKNRFKTFEFKDYVLTVCV